MRNIFFLFILFFFVSGVQDICRADANPEASDYYQRLGVPSSASEEEITAAWRKAMMKYHPDRGGTDEQSKRLNEAYDVLMKKKNTLELDFHAAYNRGTYYQKSQADIDSRIEFVKAKLTKDFNFELSKRTNFDELDKLDISLSVIKKNSDAFNLSHRADDIGESGNFNYSKPADEEGASAFLKVVIFEIAPPNIASTMVDIYRAWAGHLLPTALERILLNEPSSADLDFVRKLLSRPDIFDLQKKDSEIRQASLSSWYGALSGLESKNWGASEYDAEFGPILYEFLVQRIHTSINDPVGSKDYITINSAKKIASRLKWKLGMMKFKQKIFGAKDQNSNFTNDQKNTLDLNKIEVRCENALDG